MSEFYEFDSFRVDAMRRVLLREGKPVPMSNKAFDLLLVLVRERERVLDKEELLDKIWPDTTVEENNLTVAMSGLRKALGEGPTDRRYIVTIPGRGYRFAAEVRVEQAETVGDGTRAGQHAAGQSFQPASSAAVSAPTTKRRRQLAVLLAAVFVVVAVACYFVLKNRGKEAQSIRSIRSMAVLPFKTIGAEEGEQYLGAGIADALTTKLSGVAQLRVRPSSTVLHYANANPVSAGRELSVDSVLDGQIQRSGSRMRVTVQLVSMGDGSTLWADTLDEDFTNIFQIEDAISVGVAERLRLQLTESEKKGLTRRFTQNPEAYQLYMQGRYLWDKNIEEPMRKSVEYYQQAIDRDPGFALAYVGIADAYGDLVLQGYLAPTTGYPKVKDAALKALQIDPNLAEPHNSLGVVAWAYDWDWTKAEEEFKRAAELNPDSAATHENRAFFLMTMLRFDESIADGKRAVELNPASASLNTGLGYFYFAARRYNESVPWLKKAIDLDPDYAFPRAMLAADYALSGESRQALAECSKLRDIAQSGKDPLVSAITGYASAVSGNRDQAQAILGRLKDLPKRQYVDPYEIAIVYSGLGENDAAFEWLERTYREHSMSVVFFNSDPFFLKFQLEVRFQDLIHKAHLPTPRFPS